MAAVALGASALRERDPAGSLRELSKKIHGGEVISKVWLPRDEMSALVGLNRNYGVA